MTLATASATALLVNGCSRRDPTAGSDAASPDASTPSAKTKSSGGANAIESATDRRSSKSLAEMAATRDPSLDVATRRRLARGLARVADDPSVAALAPMLSDEDDEVIAWAAYGLGFACRGHEDAHVRALASRATTWGATADAGAAKRSSPRERLDPAFAIARALGRCATPAAEQTLAAWVKTRSAYAEAAAYALGDVATRRGRLDDETITTLVDAAAPMLTAPPLRAALQPFTRLTTMPEMFRARVVDAARAGLALPGAERIFAVRALGKAGASETALHAVVIEPKFSIGERVEAARALGTLGAKGRVSAAEALVRIAPSMDAPTATMLLEPTVHVLGALLEVLRAGPEPLAQKTLYAIAAIPPHSNSNDAVYAPRAEDLRCRAAGVLARGEFDAEVLTSCAPEASEARQRARLRAVLAKTLAGPRRTAFLKLARSPNVRVREAAIEAAGSHPELGSVIRTLVAEALASQKAGLVASAADLVRAHPTRFAVEGSDKALAPEVDVAFLAAIGEAWAEDLVETKLSLMDAAAAVNHPRAKELALLACRHTNATMRQRGVKALATLGEANAKCEPREPEPAAELQAPIDRSVVLAFELTGRADSPASSLSIRLDPLLAPITSTRLAALARAGFYRGIVIHRVVPGFVVQLGDPGGDGYGGAGKLLRCETSPVPFAPFDVGMALAGRDTGSSQFFVTLSRTPHLDGDYALIGHAEGDWANVIEGDVVKDVKVTD